MSTFKVKDPADPRLLRIHGDRLIKRDIDQLLGICEYNLQDGHISQDDAEAIFTWLKNHRASLDVWPASVLYDRLSLMLADGVLDEDEQGDLLSLIMNIARPRRRDGTMAPTALPLDDPKPDLIFESRNFCFTGVFDYGSRNACMNATEQLGGAALKGITKKLHYLVIGNVGSEVWKHTSFGTKILKAIEYREAGLPIAIVSEEHWVSHVL